MNSAELREQALFALGWLEGRCGDTHWDGCERDHAACAAVLVIRQGLAALERLEAMEAALEDTTRHLGLYVQDDGHETNGPEGWVDDADPAAWDAFRRASALLSTPAPAGQQGGTDA